MKLRYIVVFASKNGLTEPFVEARIKCFMENTKKGRHMLGFLSPNAKFYPCNGFQHIQLADDLLKKEYHISRNASCETLCDLGWAILQSGFIGFIGWHNQVYTDEQDGWFEENYDTLEYAQRKAYDTTKELSDLIKEDL